MNGAVSFGADTLTVAMNGAVSFGADTLAALNGVVSSGAGTLIAAMSGAVSSEVPSIEVSIIACSIDANLRASLLLGMIVAANRYSRTPSASCGTFRNPWQISRACCSRVCSFW